jgi:hypothetical protein
MTLQLQGPGGAKGDDGIQAGDCSIVDRVDLGVNGVLSRGHLVGDVDGLGDLKGALFDGALDVGLLRLLA